MNIKDEIKELLFNSKANVVTTVDNKMLANTQFVDLFMGNIVKQLQPMLAQKITWKQEEKIMFNMTKVSMNVFILSQDEVANLLKLIEVIDVLENSQANFIGGESMKKCPVCNHKLKEARYIEDYYIVEVYRECENCNNYYYEYQYGYEREVINGVEIESE